MNERPVNHLSLSLYSSFSIVLGGKSFPFRGDTFLFSLPFSDRFAEYDVRRLIEVCLNNFS